MQSEENIKKLLREGSPKAFEYIFAQYHKSLCAYVYKIIPDTDEAKEIVQQCFVTLWEKREQAKEIVSLKSYLFRSVHNICINRFKHEQVKEKYLSEERYQLQSVFISDFENTYDEEMLQKIETLVESLPEKNKEVFRLRFFEGFRTKEVSEKLGISYRTVETHVSNALKIIREQIGILSIVIFFEIFLKTSTWFYLSNCLF